MKPFDLQEALAGKPVVLQDGTPVIIAGFNPNAKSVYKLAGWLDDEVESWDENGMYYEDNDNSKYNLFML